MSAFVRAGLPSPGAPRVQADLNARSALSVMLREGHDTLEVLRGEELLGHVAWQDLRGEGHA